jgi:hypothetical protein
MYAKVAAKAVLLAAASVLLAGSAQAATIVLSQASSDETDPADLDAVFEFSIVGGDTLSLEIENTSDYTINAVFFNGSDDVSSLSLTSVSNGSTWGPATGPQGNKAGGFGTFDFAYVSDGNTNGIQSGDTVTLLFDITGSCADTLSCTMGDFVGPDTFSSPVPSAFLAQAAAKFVQGPGDDSAYGASNGEGFPPVGVPEPIAGLLLGTGLTGLYLSGRRRS